MGWPPAEAARAPGPPPSAATAPSPTAHLRPATTGRPWAPEIHQTHRRGARKRARDLGRDPAPLTQRRSLTCRRLIWPCRLARAQSVPSAENERLRTICSLPVQQAHQHRPWPVAISGYAVGVVGTRRSIGRCC